MSILITLIRYSLIAAFVMALAGVGTVLAAYLYLYPGLPSVERLKDVQLQVPLRVYSRDGVLLAVYGEKRRQPVDLEEVPELMQKAFLAAEDDRFFEHPGVDYQGILRAAWYVLRTGHKDQGGSTITMQLTRNFFLSAERTYERKVREIFLALKVEQELSKGEIFELYLNKIYLGSRAYGVGAAAEVYYGKELGELNLAQVATIAGLPKAPSALNPLANPEGAIERRNYVLGRMLEVGYIDAESYRIAAAAPVTAEAHEEQEPNIVLEASYVGEMVRSELVSRLGEKAYTGGYRVYTTIDTDLQRTANAALRGTLLAYDLRHGYRGPEAQLGEETLSGEEPWRALSEYEPVGDLLPGLVVEVGEKKAQVALASGKKIALEWAGMEWAQPYINENAVGPEPETAADILKAGDIIRVKRGEQDRWLLRQLPAVSGALVALHPEDGSIAALIGGYDFRYSKFNRAIQAHRQPGSAFKPFIYSAALHKGFTPASLINDAPLVFDDAALESAWRPENYGGVFHGPTRLREGLTFSRNLVSIRLLNTIGVGYALDYIARFGFDTQSLPYNLSLALGSGSVTPLGLATGYAVFANGGYRIFPHVIELIENVDREVIYLADPATVCGETCRQKYDLASPGLEAPPAGTPPIEEPQKNTSAPPFDVAKRVIPAAEAYLMTSMMHDVVRRGTGRKASELGREDIAGKTGTTNDQYDAWFSGFNGDLVATAWVGFDQPQPLGSREVGGVAALPMWVDFMRAALKDHPPHEMPQPEGMITVRIDPETGLRASTNNESAIFETFRASQVPEDTAFASSRGGGGESGGTVEMPEQLF